MSLKKSENIGYNRMDNTVYIYYDVFDLYVNWALNI